MGEGDTGPRPRDSPLWLCFLHQARAETVSLEEGPAESGGHGKWRRLPIIVLTFDVLEGKPVFCPIWWLLVPTLFLIAQLFRGSSPGMNILSSAQCTAQASPSLVCHPPSLPLCQAWGGLGSPWRHGFTSLPFLWKLLGVLLAILICSLFLSQAKTARSNCKVPMGQLRAQGSRMATPITPTARGPSPQRTSTESSLYSSPSPWKRTLTSCRCLMARPSQRACAPGTVCPPPRSQQQGPRAKPARQESPLWALSSIPLLSLRFQIPFSSLEAAGRRD